MKIYTVHLIAFIKSLICHYMALLKNMTLKKMAGKMKPYLNEWLNRHCKSEIHVKYSHQ